MDSELYGLLKIRYLSTDCITIIFPAMLAQFNDYQVTRTYSEYYTLYIPLFTA